MTKIFFKPYRILGEPIVWTIFGFLAVVVVIVGQPSTPKPDYSKISLEHCHVIDNTGTTGKYLVQCDG